ncbi:hypothetical protein B0O99DRAFT_745289 [Bisporella sp. PMI_857]|nr:hypothetical protein B0O99DRAFT_745289 [Bisporella sp. PMI_857]
MMIESNRRRRPHPIQIIQIPNVEKRQDGEEDNPGTPVKKTSPLLTTPTPTGISREAGRTSLVFFSTIASSSNFSLGRIGSTQVSAGSTSSLGLTTHTKPSMYTSRPSTTSRISPTATIFTIVTQSLKEEQETPGATRTVFNSGPVQVVTVTAAAQATKPLADSIETSNPPRESGLPLGAVKPLIVLGVIASLSVVVLFAVILWRRRREKTETVDQESAEQPPMSRARDNGFRTSEDRRLILA